MLKINHLAVRPEPLDSPFVLSLSKDEWFTQPPAQRASGSERTGMSKGEWLITTQSLVGESGGEGENILSKEKFPATNAVRFLREQKVEFIERPYRYEEKGGTEVAAKTLGVDEHLTVKTLVMEDERKSPIIVLMHGDKEVSTKELARVLGVKSITPCSSETAFKHTGYMVGGISPFGTKKQLPVYVEETILSLPRIFINAGRRGLLCEVSPKDMVRVLNPITVRVAR